MSEAVGSFYEAVAGIEPLTKWALPQSDTITAAKAAPGLARAAAVAWAVRLPDRVLALSAGGKGLTALTHDGSRSTITPEGKLAASKALTAGEVEALAKELAPPADPAAAEAARKQVRPGRLLKLAASSGGRVAIAYWGGTLRVVGRDGAIRSEQMLPQDVTALTWLGDKVVAGLADGRVLALDVK
jgi:hypothetical protein